MPSIFNINLLSVMITRKRNLGYISLRRAAKEIGISASTLMRVEKKKLPDIETYFKICAWLKISANFMSEFITIKENFISKNCNCCGGELVLIRGKYPKTPQRPVCPTCTYERLEKINEISNPDYGKTANNITQ